ncbi:MAG: hypothetical protein HQL39_15490 [Alphaproteobacteria bacterium]|nr:hypothetical protein [Alphaproteobacteria bacterium]
MERRDSGLRRVVEIISGLRERGEPVTHGAVRRELTRGGATRRMGCGNQTIYRAFDRLGIPYAKRVPRAREEVKSPGNPFEPPPLGAPDYRKPTCLFCRFWRTSLEDLRRGGTVRLECRRQPPGSHGQRWPLTAPHEWCGEFMDNEEVMRVLHANHLGLYHYAAECDGELVARLAELTNLPELTIHLRERMARLAPDSRERVRRGATALRDAGGLVADDVIELFAPVADPTGEETDLSGPGRTWTDHPRG